MSKIYSSTKTTLPTKNGLNRQWYVVDASKKPVGRIATEAARILMGKHRADYTPHVDMGGCVVIINSDKLVMTGKKMERKVYFRHDNGRIGSLKHRTMPQQMALDSSRPLYLAIKRMLPKNRHQDILMNNRVHIFKDENHKFTQTLIPMFDKASVPMEAPKVAPKIKVVKPVAKVVTETTPVEVITAPVVETVEVKAPAKRVTKKAVTSDKDDLKKIEGIGPKIEQILNENGVTTFEVLSKTDSASIKDWLNNAGSQFAIHDPSTWPQQAVLAAEGRFEELKALQAKLDGGKAD
jgi:large subunit ribosomal protein L13